MPVGDLDSGPILPVKGIRLSSIAAGIRYPDRDDLVLFELSEGSACAAVFTRNAFCAAPVIVAREHCREAGVRYLLINSGNANAGTGTDGLRNARRSCELLAEQTGQAANTVLPFSTGVIGEPLPMQPIEAAIPGLLAALNADRWRAAAAAIMTTDTVSKLISRQFSVLGTNCTITGICKGAGMIRPDMATMLAFIATDAAVQGELLQDSLRQAMSGSFNRITVDGDTSTNDACVLMATGQSGAETLNSHLDAGYTEYADALGEVCTWLAQAIVRDGEGATRFISINIQGGRDVQECLEVAYTVAHSPLVKTAFFAGDPNWGRILAAVGRADVPDLDVNRVSIYLDDVCIVRDGGRADEYQESAGQRVMDQEEIAITINLRRGEAQQTVWTTDFSYDYVKINAEYRS